MKHERERGEAIFAAYSMDEAKNLGCPLTPTYKMQVLHSPAEDEEETYSCKVSQSSDKKNGNIHRICPPASPVCIAYQCLFRNGSMIREVIKNRSICA